MQQIFILKEPLNNIKKASDIFKKINRIKINYSQENVILFYLNTRNKVLHKVVLFKGGLNQSVCEPNLIFRIALLKNAKNIILAHNHPSGNLTPSQDDINLFEMLMKAGEIINIDVLDSIIFNKKEFYSIKEVKKEMKSLRRC
jgi:DNA repair protein RadC